MSTLNTVYNRLLANLFVIFFVWYLITYFRGAEAGFGILGSIITVIGVFLPSYLKKKKAASHTYNPIRRTILRKEQQDTLLNNIQSDGNVTILTGDSGCGKTILIQQLKNSMDKDEIEVVTDNYFKDIKPDSLKCYQYVVFDQFERAIWMDNIKDQIYAINELKKAGIKITIVLRKEYVGDIFLLLKGQAKIFYLNNNGDDFRLAIEFLQDISKRTESALKKDVVLNTISNDFKENRLTFMQLILIGMAIRDDGLEALREFLSESDEKPIFNYNDTIKAYMERIISNCPYRDAAKKVLYLLSMNSNVNGHYSLWDFQNITYKKTSELNELLSYLLSTGWIREVNINPDTNDGKTLEYEVSHDYYQAMLQDICIGDIDPQIKKNIDYYHMKYCQIPASERSGFTEQVNHNFKKYIGEDKIPTTKKVISAALIVFLFLITALNLRNLFFYTDLKGADRCLELAFLQISLLGSVMYIYNYFYYFVSIFQYRYMIGIVTGYLSCFSCLLFDMQWGIWLGLEVVVLSFILLNIHCRYHVFDQNFFRSRFIVFGLIGAVIIMLGIYFPSYTQGRFSLMVPFFLLFWVYALMSISAHINERNFMALIGKVFYDM